MTYEPDHIEWIEALQCRDDYLKLRWQRGERNRLAYCPDTGQVAEILGTSYALGVPWVQLSGGGWPLHLFDESWEAGPDKRLQEIRGE